MRRVVVFINGRTEWVEKYEHLPYWLDLPDDCGYLTWDHRGQGASTGTRSFIDTYDTYVEDAAAIIQHVVGNRPYSIFAHSMGGLIALLGLLQGTLRPASFAMSAPLLRLPNIPLPRILSQPIAHLVSRVGFGQLPTGAGKHDRANFPHNKLTHCVQTYEKIHDSPYPCPSATFGWIDETFRAISRVSSPAMLKKLAVPTLLMAGDEEAVVDSAGFTEWIGLATKHSRAPVSFHIIHGARHELFSEIPEIRNAAIRKIKSWFGDFLAE